MTNLFFHSIKDNSRIPLQPEQFLMKVRFSIWYEIINQHDFSIHLLQKATLYFDKGLI